MKLVVPAAQSLRAIALFSEVIDDNISVGLRLRYLLTTASRSEMEAGKSNSSWLLVTLVTAVVTCLCRGSSIRGGGSNNPDAAVLLAFKSCIRDPWQPVFSNWEPSRQACTWNGVGCNNSSRVVFLDLHSSKLNGSIPLLLFNELPFLSHLNLSFNNLGGSIPQEVGNATRLEVLDLSSNRLSGVIPGSLGQLLNLQFLWLHSNDLVGAIPGELGLCHRLVELRIGGSSQAGYRTDVTDSGNVYLGPPNQIVGTIPPSLSNCSGLQVLQISGTRVGGEVPRELAVLSSLAVLDLRLNRLVGSVKPWLANLTSLQILDLSCNDLSGSVPWELGLLENLVELRLGAQAIQYGYPYAPALVNVPNGISGSIPSSLGRLKSLRAMALTDTLLGGEIPSSISNCTSLKILNLHTNRLSGSIPPNLPGSLRIIELHENALQGRIPVALGNLSELQVLALRCNDFIGPLPRELGLASNLELLSIGGGPERGLSKGSISGILPQELGQLSKLLYLIVSPGVISGNLPLSLANCSRLSLLFISFNNLLGTIPQAWANLTSLTVLGLEGNGLEGSISMVDWQRFSLLEYLSLQHNSLTGAIPHSIGHLQELQALALNHNLLTESIPQTLRNCSDLQWLFLHNNALSGSIEDVFDRLRPADERDSVLSGVVVARNRFTGNLPNWLPQFKSLRLLVLAGNDLDGPIPSTISDMNIFRHSNQGNVEISLRSPFPVLEVQLKGAYQAYYSVVSSLTILDLSSNRLTGDIPGEFGAMLGLHYLNLSDNHLAGSIPASLGDMEELEQMDLSSNQLVGRIPVEFGKLSSLGSFDVSHNNLTGRIPDLGPQLSSLGATSFEGNPGLCGKPLNVQCSTTTREKHEKVDITPYEGLVSYEALSVGFAVAFPTSFWLLWCTRIGRKFTAGLLYYCLPPTGCRNQHRIEASLFQKPL